MARIKFITQGCSANQADSEVMAGLLQEAGHTISEEGELVIFNTCTVKGPTDTAFQKQLKELKRTGKQVVVTGCIPQSEPRREELRHLSQVGTYQIGKIVTAVEETSQGKLARFLDRDHVSPLNLPRVRRNSVTEIVPISQGCLDACSFCKTKHARGQLFSYPVDDIVRHVSNAVQEGVKAVWLTSQDNSAYGSDIDSNLAELVRAISSIPAEFKVRVGMGNPDHFEPILDEFIQALKHDRVYKFVHIPVQAGSDRVLSEMKRNYTSDRFSEIISRVRAEIPRITVATDIICGFPTETEQDFEKTLELVGDLQFDVINISRFWPRPGTPAARLKPLPGSEVKRRTRLLTELFYETAAEINRNWLGWRGTVLVTDKGKPGSMLARNFAYKQIILKDDSLQTGQQVEVEVIDNTPMSLIGRIVEGGTA